MVLYITFHLQGFKDEDLWKSLNWWAANVANYCPSRPSQLTKKNITKHGEQVDENRCTSFVKSGGWEVASKCFFHHSV